MEQRLELLPGVCLTAVQTDKFKTGCFSINFLRPMCREEASGNALIPSVLLRGSESAPTIRAIADSGICVAIVTHNMEQATRVSDRTAFFYMGDMIETGTTRQIFSAPKDQRLSDYLTGRFG